MVDVTARRSLHARPLAEHDEFLRTLNDWLDGQLQDRLPTMGTVTGMDGGRVKVQVDEEDEPRDVGMARKVGQDYRANDRVLLVPSRSGEWMVAGTISAGDGEEKRAVGGAEIYKQAIGGEHLAGQAVDSTKLKDNAVTAAKLAGDSVDSSHLKPNSVTKEKIAAGAVDTPNLSGPVQNSLNKADSALQSVKESDIPSSIARARDIPKAPDLSGYAKTTALGDYAKDKVNWTGKNGNQSGTVQAAISEMSKRIKDLEGKQSSR